MNVNLDYYKVFYYVAKYGKISLAAERMYVSQPAITQTIKRLEEQLGTVLFNRNRDGIELTNEGKLLYEITSSNIENLENAEYKFSKYENLEEGIVRLCIGININKKNLFTAIERFSKQFPKIRIDISTDTPNVALRKIVNGELDFGFYFTPFKHDEKNILITDIGDVHYVFAMSKKYAKENNVKISKVKDLENYTFIFSREGSSRKEIAEKIYPELKEIKTNIALTSEKMKKDFLMRDMGIVCILKEEIEEELKDGTVELIKFKSKTKDEDIKGDIGMITLKKDYMSFATKKLYEYIKEECNEND